MRILYLSARLNADDGSAVHGREFVKALRELGHQVTTYPPIRESMLNASRELPNSWVSRPAVQFSGPVFRKVRAMLRQLGVHPADVIDVTMGYASGHRTARTVLALITSQQPHLIVYRFAPFDFVPNLVRRKVGTPMIAEINAIDGLERLMAGTGSPKRLARWTEAYAQRPADAMTVVSEPIRDYLLSLGVTKPIVVVRNAADPQKFVANPLLREELRSSYGLVAAEVTLGYVGSYQRWHGLVDSLRVLQALVAEGLRVRFVAIGSGRDQPSFDAQVRALGLERHVTQVRRLAHDEVAAHMNLIDIALMTYPHMEHFYFSPLKLFEYLASGVPVVTSRLGQIEEVLGKGDFGRLVPAGDVSAFVKATRELVLDADLRKRLGLNGRMWAEQHCSWRRNASDVVELGRTIMRSRR